MTFEEMERGLKGGLQDSMTVQGVGWKPIWTVWKRIMQAAMAALFDRMDRFIRGLKTNGHKGRGEA
jgi:hypothetical protein